MAAARAALGFGNDRAPSRAESDPPVLCRADVRRPIAELRWRARDLETLGRGALHATRGTRLLCFRRRPTAARLLPALSMARSRVCDCPARSSPRRVLCLG